MARDPKNYSELLKDPRWQKKRLEILSRDKFTCQDCGNTSDELHVHHKYYTYGKKPWDYDNDLLITLCYKCHSLWEANNHIIYDFTKVLLSKGWTPLQLLKLLNQIIK